MFNRYFIFWLKLHRLSQSDNSNDYHVLEKTDENEWVWKDISPEQVA